MAAFEELPDTDIILPRKRQSICVNRPAFTEEYFQEIHKENIKEKDTLRKAFRRFLGRQKCNVQRSKSCVKSVFPILSWLPVYDIKYDLMGDLAAGLTVGIMRLPQGMAYGLLATLAPVYGLYTVFFPAVLYALMGTSRHLSVGSFAVISIMTAACVDRVVEESRPEGGYFDEGIERAKIASSLAFLVGMVQFGMGVLQLGFVSTYLAEPLVRGFTTGAAFHVFNSQFKYLFGIEVERYNGPFSIIKTFIALFANLASTNPAELLVAVVNLLFLVTAKELQDKYQDKIKFPIPLELIVIILTTMVSHFASLEFKYGLDVVGSIPTGMPSPEVPVFHYMESMITDAIIIAIVTFSVSVSMGYIFAKRNHYEIDPNQELIALGSMSVFGSFFWCYPAASSLSRSLLQEMTGGKTQLASLVSCVFVLLVLLFMGPLFYALPKSCLAAIVVVALRGMFRQFRDLKVLWKYSKTDCMIWVVAWLSTFLLGVDYGLAVGVVFAIMTVIVRTQKPYCCLMGRIPGTDIYRDITYYKCAKEIPGVKIFRMHSPLYYVNAENIKDSLYSKTELHPAKILTARAKKEAKKLKAEEQLLKMEVRRRKKDQKHTRLEDGNEMETPMNTDATSISANNHNLGDSSGELDHYQMKISDHPSEESTTEPNKITMLVLDLGSVSFLDTVGISALKSIISDYEKIGITVVMAHCKELVREMLLRSGFMTEVGLARMYVTLHDAVLHITDDKTGMNDTFDFAHIPGGGGDAAYEIILTPKLQDQIVI